MARKLNHLFTHRVIARAYPWLELESWRDLRRTFSVATSPFHLAIPVHDLNLARAFYGGKLGFEEGRSSKRWQDYNALGHQLVCHEVASDYRGQDYFNPVDKDDVPVPHFGVALTVDDFHKFAKKVEKAKIKFIIEPHLRFEGKPGEQWTMFFKDPSGNNLEFKAMTFPANLFAKYFVSDTE